MITILVTAVAGGSVGGQVVKALRQSALAYSIVGTNLDGRIPSLFGADVSLSLPPVDRETEYLAALEGIRVEHGVWYIIPGSDKEVDFLSGRKLSVPVLVQPRHVWNMCSDKWTLSQYLAGYGFDVPKASREINGTVELPVVVKPRAGSSGSRNVFIARDTEELDFFYRYLKKQDIRPLVQQYVGKPEAEYTVGVLHDFEGEFLGSIIIKRILEGLSSSVRVENLALSSGISQGCVVDEPAIAWECKRIAEVLGSRGPMNVQCRVSDSKVYPFEVNPRFSGSASIRAMAGFNEPDRLIRRLIFNEKAKVELRYNCFLRGISEHEVWL